MNSEMLGMLEVINGLQVRLNKCGAVAQWATRGNKELHLRVWFNCNGEHYNVERCWSEMELSQRTDLESQFDNLVHEVSLRITQEHAKL